MLERQRSSLELPRKHSMDSYRNVVSPSGRLVGGCCSLRKSFWSGLVPSRTVATDMGILRRDNDALKTCATFFRVLHFVARIMNKFTILRDDFNLTQRQLAELLGVARNTVARWEVGICNPPKIAELAVQALRPMLRKRLEYRKNHGS